MKVGSQKGEPSAASQAMLAAGKLQFLKQDPLQTEKHKQQQLIANRKNHANPFQESRNEPPRYELKNSLSSEQSYVPKQRLNADGQQIGKSRQNPLDQKASDIEISQYLGHSRFDSDISRGCGEEMMAQLGEQGLKTANFNFADFDSSFESINRPQKNSVPGAAKEQEKASYTQLPSFIKGQAQTRNDSRLGNDGLDKVAPQNRTSNYYLSNLGSNIVSQQLSHQVSSQATRRSQNRLDDYFQQMAPKMIQGTRSNSQAVRGAKVRGTENTGTVAFNNANNNTNTVKNHVFMNQRVGNRSMPINKAVLDTGNISANQSLEAIPNPNMAPPQYARVNLNTQGQSENRLSDKIVLKAANKRTNRNKATAGQQSRGTIIPQETIYNSSSMLNAEKPSIDRSLNNSHQSRQSYKSHSNQKLNPISDQQPLNQSQKNIQSGSYVIHQEKLQNATQQFGLVKEYQSNQQYVPASVGFKQQPKIPTLSRKVTQKKRGDAEKKSSRRQEEDQLLVTFFDKPLVSNPHSSRQEMAQSSERKQVNVTDSINHNTNKRQFFDIDKQMVENTRASAGHSSPFLLQADFGLPNNHPLSSNQPRYQDQEMNLSQYEGRSSTQSESIQHILSLKAKLSPKVAKAQSSNNVNKSATREPLPNKLEARMNYQSQKNLAPHTQQRAFSFNQPQSNNKLNSSLVIPPINQVPSATDIQPSKPPKTMEQTIKNLHPQSLYLGNKARPRKQNHQVPSDELSGQKGRRLNFDQARSVPVSMKKAQSDAPPPCYNDDGDYTSQEMLVRECSANRQQDLSEEAGSESGSNKLIKQNFHYFQGQPGSNSLDASPITKQFSFQKKVHYKSRVNIKSNLKGEMDRESQRSLIESTNAYIKAKQGIRANQTESLNASCSGGVGSTTATTVNATTVNGTAAPYSPAALPPNVQGQQPHLMPAQLLKLQSTAAQQRVFIESGGSKDYSPNQNQQQNQQSSVGSSNNYDPDSSLFQLRSEVQQVPYVVNKRQVLVPVMSEQKTKPIEKFPGVKMKTQAVTNSYQTLSQKENKMRDQYQLTAEKQHSFEQNHASPAFASSVNLNSSFNVKQNLNISYKQIQSNSNQVQSRIEQNPFKKGPKLHLFRKSRRLKTSSATRTQNNEDEDGAIDRHASIDAPYPLQDPLQVNIGYIDLQRQNKTVEQENKHSKSFVYGTIENGARTEQMPTPLVIPRKVKQHAELTPGPAPKQGSIVDLVNLNEDSAEKDYTEQNPYVYKNVKAKADPAMRPHTTEKSNKQGQSIIDVYSDGYGPNEQSERSGTNPVTVNSNAPQTAQNQNMNINVAVESSGSRNGANSAGKYSRGSKGSRASKTSKGPNLVTNCTAFNGETTLDDAFKHSFYNSNMMNTGDNRSNRSPFGVTLGKQGSHKIPIGSRNSKEGLRTGKSKGSNSVKSNSSKTYQINGADLNIIKNYNENQSQQALKRRQTTRIHRNYDNVQTTDSRSDLDGKMNRNDSSETPCFMHTPQRTDSNWNGSAYLNQTHNNKSRALYTAMMSKTRESGKDEHVARNSAKQSKGEVPPADEENRAKNTKKSSSIDETLTRGPSMAK